MLDFDPKAFLLFALHHFGIQVEADAGKMIHLEKGYIIEIEGENLFKLIQHNQVIAPFDNVEELCHFIKQDLEFHE